MASRLSLSEEQERCGIKDISSSIILFRSLRKTSSFLSLFEEISQRISQYYHRLKVLRPKKKRRLIAIDENKIKLEKGQSSYGYRR